MWEGENGELRVHHAEYARLRKSVNYCNFYNDSLKLEKIGHEVFC